MIARSRDRLASVSSLSSRYRRHCCRWGGCISSAAAYGITAAVSQAAVQHEIGGTSQGSRRQKLALGLFMSSGSLPQPVSLTAAQKLDRWLPLQLRLRANAPLPGCLSWSIRSALGLAVRAVWAQVTVPFTHCSHVRAVAPGVLPWCRCRWGWWLACWRAKPTLRCSAAARAVARGAQGRPRRMREHWRGRRMVLPCSC